MSMDETMRIDFTDWATLLEVLDGARAPFAALSTLTGAWIAAMAGHQPPPPASPHPPGRAKAVKWRLVP